MKLIIISSLSFLLFSCSQNQQNENSIDKAKTYLAIAQASLEISFIDATDLNSKITDSANYEVCYITVADTGTDYFRLHKVMNEIAPVMGLPIDTLGKEFSIKKQRIVMPENSTDEMYRGEYYPRRYTSNALSLEYLNYYFSGSSEKNMALITNICGEKDSALYYAKQIPQKNNHVFVVKSNVYVGCMH